MPVRAARDTTARNTLTGTVRAAGALYACLSVLPLVLLVATAGGWPGERATVVSTSKPDGRVYDGFAMTYEGVLGGVLLWAQMLAVLAALPLSFTRGRTGLAAHGVLAAWTLLLAANFWWVTLAGGYDAMRWTLPVVAGGFVLVAGRGTLALARRTPRPGA